MILVCIHRFTNDKEVGDQSSLIIVMLSKPPESFSTEQPCGRIVILPIQFLNIVIEEGSCLRGRKVLNLCVEEWVVPEDSKLGTGK